MSSRSPVSFLLAIPIIAFALCSCAPFPPVSLPEASAPPPAAPSPTPKAKPVPDEKTVKDHFSRTYSEDFMSFYPKLHSALQNHANRHKGNSFQVVRVGSDAVIFRGIYRGEGDQNRFLTVITAKPVGAQKTLMEIKISSITGEGSSAYWEMAAKDLFQIVEKGLNPSR